MYTGIKLAIDDSAKLVNDGNSIITSAEEFQKEITNIYNIVDELKNSWTGESATRYTNNIESFRGDFQTLARTLGEFGSLIASVGADYEKLESDL